LNKGGSPLKKIKDAGTFAQKNTQNRKKKFRNARGIRLHKWKKRGYHMKKSLKSGGNQGNRGN